MEFVIATTVYFLGGQALGKATPNSNWQTLQAQLSVLTVQTDTLTQRYCLHQQPWARGNSQRCVTSLPPAELVAAAHVTQRSSPW